MTDWEDLDPLIDALADTGTRPDAAARLAATLGCDEVLLLVLDHEVGAFLPVIGMPKTLHGGPLWRRFLSACIHPGMHEGDVDLPAGERRRAWGASGGGALVVALGGGPDEQRLRFLARRMGVLGMLLACQQARRQQEADVGLARAAAEGTHSLLIALEASRAQAAKLNVKLTEEGRRKDEFLAMLGHELRNPLAPLVHAVELLRLGPDRPDPAVLTRALGIMSRQLSHMTRLVNDLLDVSRVSRGAIELQREVVALGDILQLACETAAPAIAAKGHRLELNAPECPIHVQGDRARLVQVFGNLLNNAAKFTPAGGVITVSSSVDTDRATISIRDSGLGIPPEMLDTIFQLFSQAHSTLARSEGGLGIGLTLARTLVQLHGGTIEAHSDGPGRGSVFVVNLPASVATQPSEDAAPRVDPSARPGARVLLVEDNPDNAATMRNLLQHLGAEVRVAADGEEALATCTSFDPQVVLLDIGLPGISGYETARRMRAVIGTRARLVALTGYGSGDAERRAQAAGFDEHMVKPASVNALERLLSNAPLDT